MRYERIGDLGAANGTGNVDISALNPNPSLRGQRRRLPRFIQLQRPRYPHRSDKGWEHVRLQWRRPEHMESASGIFLVLPGSERFVLRGGAGMYHTTTEGQMNLQTARKLPPAFGAFSPARITAFYRCQSLPGSSGLSRIYALLSLNRFHHGCAVDDLASSDNLSLQSRRAIPTPGRRHPWTSRTPEHATCTRSWAGRSTRRPSPLQQTRFAAQTTNTVANIPLRAPYLGWTANTMYYFETGGEAWYNALQQRSRRESIACSTRPPSPGRDC